MSLKEIDELLFKVETTSEKTFYLMACCMGEAASLADDYCEEYNASHCDEHDMGVPIVVCVADGPLIVDNDDEDDPEEDDAEPPLKLVKETDIPVVEAPKLPPSVTAKPRRGSN